MLSTNQKGASAELAIAHAALELGVGVAKPFGDERYDLLFDLRPALLRVQCKLAVYRGDVVIVRCCRARRTAAGVVRRSDSADEVDVFAAYCAETRTAYLLPLDFCRERTTIQLRLTPARNRQRAGVNWARDFEFAARLRATQGP